MSLSAQDIRAYDFFNCRCPLPQRHFNKRWFGHKYRRKRCECATVNNRLGWLVVFLLCMEYLLFLSDSIGTIWSYTNSSSIREASSWLSHTSTASIAHMAIQSGGRLSYRIAAISTAFSVVCTALILFLVLALKWYMSNPLYKAFFVFACSLVMSAGQYVSYGYQAYAIANTLALLYHLLSSKTGTPHNNATPPYIYMFSPPPLQIMDIDTSCWLKWLSFTVLSKSSGYCFNCHQYYFRCSALQWCRLLIGLDWKWSMFSGL